MTVTHPVPIRLHRHEAAEVIQTWALRWYPSAPHLAVLEHEQAGEVPATSWWFPRRLLGEGQFGLRRHGVHEAFPDGKWLVVRDGESAAILPVVVVREFLLATDADGQALLDVFSAAIDGWLAGVS